MTDHVESTISYEQWGLEFFRHAVSETRILGPISTLAGESIEFGPIKVGPGRVASVTASGKVGQAVAEQRGDDPVQYHVRLPVDLDFTLDLGVSTHRFTAQLDVPLVLTALAVPPLTVFIDVRAPSPKEIGVDLHADGLRSAVVKEVADIKGELRRFVAKYISREVDKPHILKARTVDVLTLLDGGLDGHMRPGRP